MLPAETLRFRATMYAFYRRTFIAYGDSYALAMMLLYVDLDASQSC